MVRRLHRHPDMTAAEMASILGVTPSAVRHARQRYGRYTTGSEKICVACDERPVWDGSRAAKRMGLCKACFLEEMDRRDAERRDADRVRQRAHRSRRSG